MKKHLLALSIITALLFTTFIFAASAVHAMENMIVLHNGNETQIFQTDADSYVIINPFQTPGFVLKGWNSSEKSGEVEFEPDHVFAKEDCPSDLYAVLEPLTIYVDGIEIEKQINGSSSGSQIFHFEINEISQDTGKEEISQVCSIEKEGTVVTAGWTYDHEGTRIYRIHEVNEKAAGWTYSSAVYYVINDVTYDPKDNAFHSTQRIEDENHQTVTRVIFTNTYTGSDALSTGISFEKEVSGPEIQDAEYTFILRALSASQPMPEGSENGAYMIHASKGMITTPQWTYHGFSTWTYTLQEVKGETDGCIYDETVYTIKDTTQLSEDGLIKLEREITDSEGNAVPSIVFHNTYIPENTPIPSSPPVQVIQQEKIVPSTDAH